MLGGTLWSNSGGGVIVGNCWFNLIPGLLCHASSTIDDCQVGRCFPICLDERRTCRHLSIRLSRDFSGTHHPIRRSLCIARRRHKHEPGEANDKLMLLSKSPPHPSPTPPPCPTPDTDPAPG